MEITERLVETNGIRMKILEAGRGPLVLLLHGFPELAYSWRHQLTALSEAGYRVVAPDQRGYGGTSAPDDVAQYGIFHLVGDLVQLMQALGEEKAVVVGHDWGANVAAHMALIRPDLLNGVALLSVPFFCRDDTDILTKMTDMLGPENYVAFFQKPGVAEAQFDKDPENSLRTMLIASSGESQPAPGTRLEQDGLPVAAEKALPSWMGEEEWQVFAAAYRATGFRGGINWYRNVRANWEHSAPWHGTPLLPPSLFIAGDRDVVYHWPGYAEAIARLSENGMPNLRKSVILEGCGHWTQQERPAEVNALLIEFLNGLGGPH